MTLLHALPRPWLHFVLGRPPALATGCRPAVGARMVFLALVLSLGLHGLSRSPAQAQQIQGLPPPLPVPFIGQGYCYRACPRDWWNGHNNCGPASLAMVVEANGRRPAGLSNLKFVAQARERMTDQPDRCSNPPTTRADLDRGAARYGLCQRPEAWSLEEIRALTDQCLPVIAFVEPARLPLRNPGWFGTLDHILVITGVGDHFTSFNDPLDFGLPCTPSICDENAVCGRGGRASNDAMRDALFAADYGWWGRAYGDALGDCDLPGCGSGGAGGGVGGQEPKGEPLDEVRVRMSSHCPTQRVQLFWATNDDESFTEERSQIQVSSQDWRDVTFGMAPYDSWRGRLHKLRFDPTTRDVGCTLGISYVWLTNRFDDAGRLWHFSEVAGRGRGCPLLGWRCKGLVDRFLPGAWIMQTTRADPWIVTTGEDIDLRR